jgi:hypothetical protein
MSADQDISQNSRKAKHNDPDARLSDRNRRETGIISYHHAVLRNLTAYFALGGVIVGLRPSRPGWYCYPSNAAAQVQFTGPGGIDFINAADDPCKK